MRTRGTSSPWPTVTVELNTFELQVIDDALAFAAGEVEQYDVQTIALVRDDIKRTLLFVDRQESRRTFGNRILRRRS
jgi:hypothetical protein